MSVEAFVAKIKTFPSAKEMFVQEHGSTTYGQFLQLVQKKREFFKEKGCSDKVTLWPEYYNVNTPIELTALALEKAIVIPYHSKSPERVLPWVEVSPYALNTDAKQLETNKYIDELKSKKRAGLIISSTGTTGKPKWVVHDLERLFAKYLKLKNPRKVPFVYHMDNVSGIELFLSIASAGGQFLMPKSSHPQNFSDGMTKLGHTADLLSLTPTYLRLALMNWKSETFQNVKDVNLGGERLIKSDLENFQKALPLARIHSFYGTTESSSIQTKTLKGTNFVKWGCEGVNFKVCQGELFLKKEGYHMLGYLTEELSPKDNWYPTGDLVEPRDYGYYEIVGRKDARFNVGGKQVDPLIVEQVLLNFGVPDCRVYSEENSLLGNIVVAKLQLEKSKDVEAALRKHCSENLPPHACPIRYIYTNNFGMNNRFKRN
ncbi:MAG: AMP-binding protein [Bacteroidia bacterium]